MLCCDAKHSVILQGSSHVHCYLFFYKITQNDEVGIIEVLGINFFPAQPCWIDFYQKKLKFFL